MKKTVYLLVFLCFLGFGNLKAQSPVATLEHNDTTTVFYGINAFSDAYTASQNGDLIFLSSGTFNSPSYIEKGIKVYGAGCYLDATSNNTTTLTDFYLNPGSDNFLLEGVICTNIYFNDRPISNLSFLRCRISNIFSYGSSGTGNFSNILIENCIILASLSFNNWVTSSVIRNNIFHNNSISYSIYGGSLILIENNVFYNSYSLLTGLSDCYFTNNVFYSTYSSMPFSILFGSLSNCTFLNNLFHEGYSVNISGYPVTNVSNTTYGNNILLGNYYTTYSDSIFTSTIASPDYFSFQNDYHMKYPLFFKGADNAEVGVYGGTNPFKENALPSNPHIVSKSIATQTDLNGNLPVNIKAKAQKY